MQVPLLRGNRDPAVDRGEITDVASQHESRQERQNKRPEENTGQLCHLQLCHPQRTGMRRALAFTLCHECSMNRG